MVNRGRGQPPEPRLPARWRTPRVLCHRHGHKRDGAVAERLVHEHGVVDVFSKWRVDDAHPWRFWPQATLHSQPLGLDSLPIAPHTKLVRTELGRCGKRIQDVR
eukprot:CAMPEP_0115865118 /NCGR_PEP_ID=MMETSP0287-20121206/19555_1 /TAXON_ID=412157 /ORGANISM="Chrysochromulina rotalis, Strain UIO044" /LENGTH=103 /DNA_ID=CAMNT_0003319617 /DNA_START=313 /DNA_END=624 /DNA_ORIENTATION=+